MSSSTTYVTVPDKYVGKVDAAFRVSGSNLEPIYSDGDFLLVEYTNQLNHGDLGVFLLGGTVHVRRFHSADDTQKLLPLCVDIPEIPVDDSVSCLGRVLGCTSE